MCKKGLKSHTENWAKLCIDLLPTVSWNAGETLIFHVFFSLFSHTKSNTSTKSLRIIIKNFSSFGLLMNRISLTNSIQLGHERTRFYKKSFPPTSHPFLRKQLRYNQNPRNEEKWVTRTLWNDRKNNLEILNP